LSIQNNVIKSPITLNFEKKIIIDSELFHRNIKDINNIVDFIQIDCDNNKFKMSCIGDKEGEIILNNENNNDNITIINENDNLVSGIYEIKNIILFNKLTKISENFSLYMKNEFALTSVYSFGEYGSFTTILSPVNEEYINNVSYDYSDDEDEIDLIKSNNNLINLY